MDRGYQWKQGLTQVPRLCCAPAFYIFEDMGTSSLNSNLQFCSSTCLLDIQLHPNV